MAKETAEQKLLKLIEQTNAQQATQAGKSVAAPAEPNVSVGEAQKVFQSVSAIGVAGIALPAALLNGLNFLKGMALGSGQGFGLREFNRIFMVVILILGAFFVSDLVHGMRRSQMALKKIFGESLTSHWGAQGAVWTSKEQPFEQYAELFAQRNIFQPFEVKIAKKPELIEQEKAGIEKIAEQVRDLKLVGISWLDTPESASAMIENTSSGTTYFLGEGDKIQSVTIKKIFADSIVVSDGQQEMELRL